MYKHVYIIYACVLRSGLYLACVVINGLNISDFNALLTHEFNSFINSASYQTRELIGHTLPHHCTI